MKKINLLIIGMATILNSSCVKDELFDTSHPDTGGLTVTTDWSDKSDEAMVPDSYILMVGDIRQNVSGETNHFGKLLSPGIHTLYVYNLPQGISLNGTTISVDPLSEDAILPMPGSIFISSKQFEIMEDSELSIIVDMKQFTRRLELVLTVKEGQYERVRSAYGSLSGISGAVDILTGQRSEHAESTTAIVEREENKFHLQYNLLGIVPSEKQVLKIDILFSNGDTQTIESDLSTLLTGYHNEVMPLKLTGDIFLPLESGFSGVISGWEIANGGNSDAH